MEKTIHRLGGKYSANYMSDKELVPKIQTGLLQFNNNKTNQLIQLKIQHRTFMNE